MTLLAFIYLHKSVLTGIARAVFVTEKVGKLLTSLPIAI
jgi:hypothetical protein